MGSGYAFLSREITDIDGADENVVSDQTPLERETDTDSDDESSVGFDAFLFMYTLPPYPTLLKRKVLLPPGPRHHRVTLVLDLDETLVHCSVNPV